MFAVAIERGPKRRTFAQVQDWIGWLRAEKEEQAALKELVASSARYGLVVAQAGMSFSLPTSIADFTVVDRVTGTAVTDYGAPGVLSAFDTQPWQEEEIERCVKLLQACWATFDEVLQAIPASLQDVKPQRGRSPLAMRLHLVETDLMHLTAFGPAARPVDRHRLAEQETGVRERYQQFAATARELLADFREVEENFRKLDRQLREKIAGWHGGKGELLDDVLGSRESIAGSAQGESFQAFYGFLLSQARQEELSGLLDRVHSLAGITERDARLGHIHYDWLDAAERTQATVRQLSEQLRRFLDDQVWFENRRVIDILRGIEARALRLRDIRNVPVTTELDAPAPAIRLPLERPLYAPVKKARITSDHVRDADEETDPAALFEQVYVDPEPLRGGVRQALRSQPQVGLAELVARYPLTQGAAELVTYLALQDEAFAVVYDEQHREQITWSQADGRQRTATLPRVTFARKGA